MNTDKAENKSANQISASTASTKTKSALELLEEDDEFEEFEGGSWDTNSKGNTSAIQEDTALWKDDWEDEDVNDDFADQLKQQIQARAMAVQTK